MKTIIFDLGETLLYFNDIKKCGDLDHPDNPCLINTLDYLHQKGYTKITVGWLREKLKELRKLRDEDDIERGPDKLARLLSQEYEVSSEEGNEIINIFSRTFFSSSYLDPFAKKVLTVLKKKFRLGLISNTPFGIPAEYAKEVLREYGIFDLFEFMVFSSEEKIRKPSKKIFEIAFKRHGINKREVIYVGNHPVQDIAAATNVGIVNVVLIKQKDKSNAKGTLLEDIPKYVQDKFGGRNL